MEDKRPGAGLYATYASAITGFIVALVLGAAVLMGGIMRFFDVSMILPVLGGLIDTGVVAVAAGVISIVAMNKVAHSADSGLLVSSDFYRTANGVAKFVAKALAVFGAAVAVAALLEMLLRTSTIEYNWKTYLLGSCLPALSLAAGAFASGIMIEKFEKAQIKPNVLPIVAVVVAGVALLMAVIAVAVKSNISTTSIYNSTIKYEPVKLNTSTYDY